MSAQQQRIIFGALVVVMIAVYGRAFRWTPAAPETSAPEAVPPVSQPFDAAAPSDVTVQREAQREQGRLAAWHRDPFSQASGGQETVGLTLSGILWDAARPLAVVNGTPVAVGDDIDGFRVTEITPERVVLSDGTQTHQLRLAP